MYQLDVAYSSTKRVA